MNTGEEIINTANQIWKRVKESNIPVEQHAERDKLLADIQSEFKEFNQGFPLVLRTIVQMNQYSSKAFARYLQKYKTAIAQFKERKDWVKFQAEYLFYLFREKNPKAPLKEAYAYKNNMERMLLKEDEEFQKIMEKYKVAVEEDNNQERQSLYDEIKNMETN